MSASLIRRVWHTPWPRLIRCDVCESLPLDEAIAAARLPASISALVLQTASATRLWPSEQADVCRELAAHFEDGLTAGIDARALIATFGPPAAAARLIRRAKKRARPISLKLIDRLGQACILSAAITVASLAGFAARAWMSHPNVTTSNATAIELRLRATTTRSWPALRSAFLGLPPIRVELDDAADHLLPEHAGWPLAIAYLEQSSEALRQIRACAAHDRMGLPFRTAYDTAVAEKLVRRFEISPLAAAAPPAASQKYIRYGEASSCVMGECGTLLGFAALEALHKGDASEFRSILSDWLKLARQLQGPAAIVDQAAGFRQYERVCRLVGRALGSKDATHLSNNDLHEIAAMLREWNAGSTSLDLSVEHASFDDWMQHMYTDDGDGDGHVIGSEVTAHFNWSPLPGRLLSTVLAPALTVRRKQAIELHQQMISDAQRATSAAIIDDRVRGAFEERSNANEDATTYIRRWPALMFIRHDLEVLLLTPRHAMVQRDGTLIAIAAELFRRETGAFPKSLHEIPPSVLRGVGADPFDGQPLRYNLRDNRPLVYSIGADHRDDQGAPPTYASDNLFRCPNPGEVGDWVLYPIVPEIHRIDRCTKAVEAADDGDFAGTCGAV